MCNAPSLALNNLKAVQNQLCQGQVVFTSSHQAAFGNLGNAQGRQRSPAQAVPHNPEQQKPPNPTRF